MSTGTDAPHVVAVSGSLANESGTRVALRRALSGARSRGADTELIDLRDYELPTFDSDEQDVGDAPEIRRKLGEADAILLGTPMYHGSYSSPLKTVLDYAGFDEFEGKTVGLVAVSGGRFPTPALEHLRSVVRALNAWTVPVQVGVPNSHEAFEFAGRSGELVDDDMGDRLEELGSEVVRYAGVDEYESRVSGTTAGASKTES
ncbi:MAG: NAD(P)H-dependent oxidoreductase [Halobacteria archaeon]|nr:NAD(P)H-dependent oxidoreductase [Halobacteria archaeon]